MKKYYLPIVMSFISLFSAGLFLFVPGLTSETIMTKEKAIKYIYRDAKNNPIKEAVTKKLTKTQMSAIKKKYGWRVTRSSYTYYPCKKGSRMLGRILFFSDKGKHGSVVVAVGINTDGKIKDTVVCALKEVRGKPVASKMFLRQFRNKSQKNSLKIGKDIQAVTSATISSQTVCSAIKKALILTSIIYGKK